MANDDIRSDMPSHHLYCAADENGSTWLMQAGLTFLKDAGIAAAEGPVFEKVLMELLLDEAKNCLNASSDENC